MSNLMTCVDIVAKRDTEEVHHLVFEESHVQPSTTPAHTAQNGIILTACAAARTTLNRTPPKIQMIAKEQYLMRYVPSQASHNIGGTALLCWIITFTITCVILG
jgi:hypothetical protein